MLNRIKLSAERRPNFAVRETYQGGAAQRRGRGSQWLGLLAVLGLLALLPAMTSVQSAMQTSCMTGGNLDPTFDTDGKVTTDFGSSNDFAEAIAVQPDGKIVVAGYAFVGSANDFALVRYNTDGSLDTTFDTDGKVTTAFGSFDDL